MDSVRWGIIGCGDVTEKKSGPAFNKAANSALVAVMRRDADKARDYASRHGVPKWFSDADEIINDPEVNALYIATPPSSHKALALKAMKAGKPVYLEKPMTIDATEAAELVTFSTKHNIKLSVAHYRRAQPKFKKLKQLLDEGRVGEVRSVQLDYYRRLMSLDELAMPGNAWRVDAGISGGGLFHDLAPHQLDLMYYFFGEATEVSGLAINQSGVYRAPDLVSGFIKFARGMIFSGTWCFNASRAAERDDILITGSLGTIAFNAFAGNTIEIDTDDGKEVFSFDELAHVQQPMIESVTQYFLDKGPNPCGAKNGQTIMSWLDSFTS